MGTYYHLTNDTKKQKVHLDHHFKFGPLRFNKAVHYALVNYMMDNLGDVLRMLPDDGDAPDDYDDVNLLDYKFRDDCVMPEIVRKLNAVYGIERYKVLGSVGVEINV